MADPRTFTLIGEFKDGITPELEKINKQLAALKSSFGNIGGKGARNASRDMGRFSASVSSLVDNLKLQNQALNSAKMPLREYRTEIRRTASALERLNAVGGNTNGLNATNRALTEQLRLLRAVGSAGGNRQRMSPRSTGGGGGGVRPPRFSGGGGRGGGGGGNNMHMAEFGFAYTLGNAISQPIQNAIVGGFQIGVGLMTKPFEYFAKNFGERVKDELSDLKAAGGFFSIAKSDKANTFIKTFDQAIDFTQENNKVLAKLAAALPGSTQDYIEVSKRISDSVARTVMTDKGAAVKYAEQLRQADPKMYGATAITGTGDAAQRKTIQVMLAELTKKTVLAGQGGRAGAGGAMGAYGLPQLTERMLSQDEVSMGQFQRYSAIFSDPMIMDALSKEIPNINKTAKNSVDRFKALQALYDKVLPPELVEKYKRTVAGLTETFNTAIFGPETGLFGLGRKMQGMGKKINEFGQYIDWYGKVTSDVTKAMNADLSLYDLLRDVIANVGQVLAPVVENFTLLWDPLRKLGLQLGKAREVTAKILQSFNYYLGGFEDLAKTLNPAQLKDFSMSGGKELRASVATIGNILRYFRVIGEEDFTSLINQLKDPKAQMGSILQGMIDKFLDSKVAAQIGEFIGGIIGSVLSEVAKVTGFISGRIGKSNKLMDGLAKGFEDAGGVEAMKNIFKDIFKSMFAALKFVFKNMPLEGYFMIGAMLIVPAAIQGLGMFIGEAILGAIGSLKPVISGGLSKNIAKGANKNRRGLAGLAMGLIPGTTRQRVSRMRGMQGAGQGALGSVRGAAGAARTRMFGNQYTSPIGPLPKAFAKGPGGPLMASRAKGLPKALAGITEFGKKILPIAKRIPVLSVALGALDFGLRKASGQGTGEAAGGAIGAGLGATGGALLGSALGPAGTLAGGVLGSFLGDWLGSNIGKVLENLSQTLSSAWSKFTTWASSGFNVGKTIGQLIANLENTADNIRIWFDSLPGKVSNWVAQLRVDIGKFFTNMGKILTNPSQWGKVLDGFKAGFAKWAADAGSSISTWFQGLQAGFAAGYGENRKAPGQDVGGGGRGGYQTRNGVKGWLSTSGEWTPLAGSSAKGSLGDAIASEMRMKPPGSNLVIANSSETVIPAAGGYGMKDFMSTLNYGFQSVRNQVASVGLTSKKRDDKIQSQLLSLTQNVTSLSTQVDTMSAKSGTGSGIFNLPTGDGVSKVISAGRMLQGMGLNVAENPAFGTGRVGKHAPGSYHYAGRAIDVTGPPALLDAAYAKLQGTNPAELLWRTAGHFDHLHVAYALGAGMPAFFGSQRAAMNWEKSMVPSSVKVGSVTSNSSEGFGAGPITINAPITIHQQPGQDSDELASIVAMKLGEAVAQARSASVFV